MLQGILILRGRNLARVTMLVWNEFVNDARVLKEAQTLAKAGHEVIVHALHTPGKTQVTEVLEPRVRVVRVARSPFWRLRGKGRQQVQSSSAQTEQEQVVKSLKPHRQLLRLVARSFTHLGLCWRLLRSGADAVHAHDVNVLPTAWLAAKLLRVPLVYDAHEISTDREGYQAFRKWVGWVEKKIMPSVAASITTTDMRAKFFARAYRIPRPLVLQNRPRYIVVDKTNRIRSELNLSQPWPIVLYQGGLQQGRGLPRLVKAAEKVPNAYFVFIGGGRQTEELCSLVVELGLTDRVYFIPTVSLNDLPEYTASADIGVQPIENTCLNHFSTDSNKLFEYVIAGLPVIASAMPEIRKVVQQYDLGLSVPPGDTGALIEALNTMINQPELRQHYAQQASKAAHHLNWEAQEQSLLDLYDRVLSSPVK